MTLRKKVQIISKLKEESEYNLLPIEQQDKMFYELMGVNKKVR